MNALLLVLSGESGPTAVAQGRGPLVVTLGVLLVLFLLTQSVRVVAPDARLVVRRRGAQRVEGPGIVLLAPVLDEARTISVAPVERRVVAPGAITGLGARALWVLRVHYRVTDPVVHPSDESAFRAVELATRRAVRRLTDAESAGAQVRVHQSAWLSERIAAELEDLGVSLDQVAIEDMRLVPRPAEDPAQRHTSRLDPVRAGSGQAQGRFTPENWMRSVNVKSPGEADGRNGANPPDMVR